MEPMPEEWERGLAVVAHPDDLEYGAASAIARWTSQRKTVAYLLVASGEAGIQTLDPAVCGPRREAEERAGAALVGVTDVEFLRWPDGTVAGGIELRRAIAGVVRRHRPEMRAPGSQPRRWSPAGTSPSCPERSSERSHSLR